MKAFYGGDVRTFLAEVPVTQYQVVSLGTNAGYVTPAGATSRPYGIATYAAGTNETVEVRVSGEYSAIASGTIARGAIIASGSDGVVQTATSTNAYILGYLGANEATAASGAEVVVYIDPQVMTIS
jgi:hypothetical protein